MASQWYYGGPGHATLGPYGDSEIIARARAKQILMADGSSRGVRAVRAASWEAAHARLRADLRERSTGPRINVDSRGVRYVARGRQAPASFARPVTCGSCGRTWDDAVITSVTPAPGARCPLEYMRGHGS